MRRVWGAAVLVLLLAGDLAAGSPRDPRLAQLPLPTGGGADWHQWDAFLTNVVKKLAEDLGEPQRDQLRDLFLDSRYQLVDALSLGGGSNPVPGLLRFAIPRKEDKQPGGNLARSTYSAYNGGPRALSRYRNASTIPALKKVDEAFWTKFRAVSGGQELAVKSCYNG